MAQILQSLSYKVCSTLLPKFVAIELPVLILGKSAIFNQCYAVTTSNIGLYRISSFIIPYQKLLQSDWSFTNQHFRCLILSPFQSCHVIDIMLPRKPNICHVKDIMLLCKPNAYHAPFRKVILRRVVCSDTYSP